MLATTAFKISIIVNFIICGPLLLSIGIARGWNTSLLTGSFQFKTVEDATRFWPEPNAYEQNADIDADIPGRNSPSASGTWYYWKRRPSSTTFCEEGDFDPVTNPEVMSCSIPQANAYSRAFVWTCYVVHQCLIWGLIYKAQREHEKDVQYHTHLKWYNTWSLVVNCVAYLVHLLQTHVTYDSTAQDVTEASSQASVIMLLVMVLLIEYKNRGLFLGWPSQKQMLKTGCCSWRLPTRPLEMVRKYHGYAFAWATIYTLWYHPMESTVGHVLGFLHTGFLLVQQSLMFTPVHVNKYWKLLLETWVTIHGSVVAAQTSNNGLWGMFVFGFLWMFVFTQVHGLPYYLAFTTVAEKQNGSSNDFTNKNDEGTELDTPKTSTDFYTKYVPTAQWKRTVLRLLPVLIYFAIVISCYATVLSKGGTRSIGMGLTEIIRIPPILYLMAVCTAVVGLGMISATACCFGKEETQQNDTATRLSTATVLATLAVCYTLMVVISVIIETRHIKTNLQVLMYALVVVFTVLALMVMVVMERDMGRVDLGPPQLPQSETEDETKSSNDKIITGSGDIVAVAGVP